MTTIAEPTATKPQRTIARNKAGPPYTVHFGPNVASVRRVLGALTRRVSQICMTKIADSVSEVGLSPTQYGAMSCLNPKDGEPGIDQNGLAARLGIDRNSASLLVENLEGRGLIERRVNSHDRRARLLHLTPKGELVFLQVRPKNLAAQARILEALVPQERELLLDLLIKVIAANGQHARLGAGRRKRGSRQTQSSKQDQRSLSRKT